MLVFLYFPSSVRNTRFRFSLDSVTTNAIAFDNKHGSRFAAGLCKIAVSFCCKFIFNN